MTDIPTCTDGALIDEFVAQADVADTTRSTYRTRLHEFRRWMADPRSGHPEPVSMRDARRADIARFASYLQGGDRFAAEAHYKIKTTLSASTRKSFLAALNSFYQYLITVELVEANPTVGVPRPKVKLKRGLCLSVDELRRLLEVDGSPRDRVQVYLLAFTGARVSEIRNLRWRDVNFTDGTILLHGKGDKERLIFMHPRLVPELRRWWLRQQATAERDPTYRHVRDNPATDFVLVTKHGRPLAFNAIHKQLNRRAARAGLYVLGTAHGEHRTQVSPHVLRRTFATILLNDGEHLDAVADVLGHESVDTTRKHYAFASEERRRATIHAFKV